MKRLNGFLLALLVLLISGCGSQVRLSGPQVAVSKDGERIAYCKKGYGGTALVFIHGWSCDGRYWRKQTAAFASRYSVLRVDLAGHGHSSQTRQNFTMAAFAEDIRAVLDREGIERAILVGHSMGGGVIAEAARLLPKRVVGIVGIDTLQNVDEKVPQARVEAMTGPLDKDFQRAAKQFVGGMFVKGADPKVVRWVQEDMSSAPKRIAMSALQNYLGQYVSGEAAQVFAKVDVPVVCINARLWPTSLEGNRKHIKDYHLIYIENSGHFPMLTQPEVFNSKLAEALAIIE